MNNVANVMRGALVSIAAAVDNVEAGHTTPDEREELARVCDRLADVLRRDTGRPPAIDGDVIAVVVEEHRR
ncbi:hypothetical protein REH65_30245 [Saccharopolyspora sp. ID03-671]|uniref:hypothetical protein n=1 Tax=Saccharopolyspora sp. ID03-671 TaxID=3073066 RepID=UPI00324B8B55